MEKEVSRVVNLLHAPQEWLAASNLMQLFTRFLGASLLLALCLPRKRGRVTSVLLEAGHPASGSW